MVDDHSSTTLTPVSPNPSNYAADETTALLPKPPSSSSSSTNGESSSSQAVPEYRQWLSEIWLLTKTSIPVIMAYTLQNSLQTISVLIVGRLSPEALATAAFSYSE